jgi:hypothetical protein
MVETEVEVWKDLEQRTEEGARSRRPTDEEPERDGGRRWSRRPSQTD